MMNNGSFTPSVAQYMAMPTQQGTASNAMDYSMLPQNQQFLSQHPMQNMMYYPPMNMVDNSSMMNNYQMFVGQNVVSHQYQDYQAVPTMNIMPFEGQNSLEQLSAEDGHLFSNTPSRATSSSSTPSRKRAREDNNSTHCHDQFLNKRVKSDDVIKFAKDNLDFDCDRSAAELIADLANELKGNRSSMIHSRLLAIKQKDESRACFLKFDVEKKGVLSKDGIRAYLQEVYDMVLCENEMDILLNKVGTDGVVVFDNFDLFRAEASRLHRCRPRSNSEVESIEKQCQNMGQYLQEVQVVVDQAEQNKQMFSHCHAQGDTSILSSYKRSVNDALEVISSRRKEVISLKISIQDSREDRLVQVCAALANIDYQLLVKEKKVQDFVVAMDGLEKGNVDNVERRRGALDSAAAKKLLADARIRMRNQVCSMLRKIQAANVRTLRWSRMRAQRCVDGAKRDGHLSAKEFDFISSRILHECAATSLRLVFQHCREHFVNLCEQTEQSSVGRGSQLPQSPQEIERAISEDLGAFLSNIICLRGSVRLLVEILESESPQTFVSGIFANPEYRCRVSLPLTAEAALSSEILRNIDVGDRLQALSRPVVVDGHGRVFVQLEDGTQGFVSVHSSDTFFLLEVLPLDDANPFRWTIPSAGSTNPDMDEVNIFHCVGG